MFPYRVGHMNDEKNKQMRFKLFKVCNQMSTELFFLPLEKSIQFVLQNLNLLLIKLLVVKF